MQKTKIMKRAGVGAIALVAAVISYGHIETLALHAGQPLLYARLLPFSVDGLIVVGSAAMMGATRATRWLGWLGVVPGVAATLFANVESGIPHGPLGATIAGWPAVALTVATFILERGGDEQVSEGGPEWPAPAEETVFADEVEDDLRASTGQGGPEGGPAEPEVARTTEEAAVAAYRSSVSAGQPLSQRAIAGQFGISRRKAGQLLAQADGAAA